MEGFDLDLTYVTENIIAMGFPSDGMEGLYRNHITDVQRFLNMKHPRRYKVYNLCTERAYNPELFNDKVSHMFKFQDHNPPPFFMMHEFCKDAAKFLSKNQTNVVAIHCKAGKGRTGVMICCYLVYAGLSRTAHEALLYYGEMRTLDRKGVTIPSQIRYVYYFEHFLKGQRANPEKPIPYKTTVQKIYKIRMITIPTLEKGGISPNFQVICKGHIFYDFQKQEKVKGAHIRDRGVSYYDFNIRSEENLLVYDDVRI